MKYTGVSGPQCGDIRKNRMVYSRVVSRTGFGIKFAKMFRVDFGFVLLLPAVVEAIELIESSMKNE